MTVTIKTNFIPRFPINKCHQRVVTRTMTDRINRFEQAGFQSISVTSEW